jgi:hypothetical protein
MTHVDASGSSSSATDVSYFIRESALEVSFDTFVPSWSDATFSSSDLLTNCGAMTNVLFKYDGDTSNLVYDSFDTEVFTFDASTPKVTVSSTNPLKASSNQQNYETTYNLVLMGQLGDHYNNREYVIFNMVVKDYCWVS